MSETTGTPPNDESKTKDQLVTELGEIRQVVVAIVESSDDAIVGTTSDGIITTWNGGAERLFGYTAAEAISQPVSILFPEDLQTEAPRILKHLGAGGRVHA